MCVFIIMRSETYLNQACLFPHLHLYHAENLCDSTIAASFLFVENKRDLMASKTGAVLLQKPFIRVPSSDPRGKRTGVRVRRGMFA